MAKKRLTTRGKQLLNDYDPTHRTTKLGDRVSDAERRHVVVHEALSPTAALTSARRTLLRALGVDYLIESIAIILDVLGTDAGGGGDENTVSIDALRDGAAITGVTAQEFDEADAAGDVKELVTTAFMLKAGEVLTAAITQTLVNGVVGHVVAVEVTYSPVTEDETAAE